MIYKCLKCHEKGIDSILVSDGPGYLTCKACHREIPIPEPKIQPESSSNQIAPMHGLLRKELKAIDAYQPEQPEFPLED